VELEAEFCVVKGDSVRLQQALWNVFKNAAKFTCSGGRIAVGTRTDTKTGELTISVDDNGIGMTSEELARILLTRRGYRVEAAATVAEARTIAAEQEFQLWISDMGLPDGNGFELMKELRVRLKGLQGIALTGYGMEHDVASSRESGFGTHLTKPVRVRSLEEALASAQAACPTIQDESRR
jgi:CheY-like chemotaxis protein